MYPYTFTPLILNIACYGYFCAGIFGSLFSFWAQKQFGPSSLFSHGKAAAAASSKTSRNWIATLTVPKHFFWHFYALGFLCSISKLIWFKNYASLATGLLAAQCFRRLIECFLVMPGAKGSQIHLIHYLIGITYYPMLLLSFSIQGNNTALYSLIIVLFLSASALQCYCHWLLGSARRKCSSKHQLHRPLPYALFKFIHAPHYFAEFLIYTCIAAANQFHPLSVLNLLWILSILGVSACNSADWLRSQWKYQSHRDFCKYLLLPFLF